MRHVLLLAFCSGMTEQKSLTITTTYSLFPMACAPKPSANTVLRAGAGICYDRSGPGPIADLLRDERRGIYGGTS